MPGRTAVGRDRYEGFDAFVHAGGQALTRYAYLLVLDAQLAEDLVQQALLEVASRWSRPSMVLPLHTVPENLDRLLNLA